MMTRELWLRRAIDEFRPWFVEAGYELPEQFHISVGFGHGAVRESAEIEGQCWARCRSEDHINHIFISPTIGDTMQVLRTVLHELIHAALDTGEGIEDGHKKRFANIATRLGFLAPMPSTPASPDLQYKLICIADTLGEYPHGALTVTDQVLTSDIGLVEPDGRSGPPRPHTGPKQQSSRWRKVACTAEDCPCGGYSVRTTTKWIGIGLPMCPMGQTMEQTGGP